MNAETAMATEIEDLLCKQMHKHKVITIYLSTQTSSYIFMGTINWALPLTSLNGWKRKADRYQQVLVPNLTGCLPACLPAKQPSSQAELYVSVPAANRDLRRLRFGEFFLHAAEKLEREKY